MYETGNMQSKQTDNQNTPDFQSTEQVLLHVIHMFV